jgi:DNA-binding FadR family transcriptional regulator
MVEYVNSGSKVATRAAGVSDSASDSQQIDSAPILAFDMPKRASRAEAAAQAVERRIITDELRPGTRLGTRRDLGDLLAVAPSTVSEAIKLLEDRGRVVTRTGPGGGVFVAEPGVGVRLARSMMRVSGSEGEVTDALQVRDILETAVIVGAAEAAHPAARLADLKRAMQSLRAATDMAAFYRRNLEFHAEVAALCHNEMLQTIYRSLLEIVQARDPKLALLPGQDAGKLHARRTQVHQDIVDAIAKGDVSAARAAARAHAKRGHAARKNTS